MSNKALYSKVTGKYKVFLLARHPNDRTMSDDLTQWWQKWHKVVNNDEC